MIRLAFVAALVTLLTACSTPSPYGAFIKDAPMVERMVGDTTTQLVKMYPPASSRLDVKQATQDAFGKAFVADLREKGFAIGEGASVGGGLALNYKVDQAADLYRLTVFVDDKEMSRAYAFRNNTVTPAGAWTIRQLAKEQRQ